MKKNKLKAMAKTAAETYVGTDNCNNLLYKKTKPSGNLCHKFLALLNKQINFIHHCGNGRVLGD